MTKQNNTTTNADKKEQEIALILQLLQSRVDDFTQEISISKEIHEGNNKVRTKLTSSIEKAIENPFAPLISLRTSIDNTITSLVETLFKALFETNKELIQEVYKSNNSTELTYLIVLNEDSFDNRETIFGLLDFYENKTDEFASFYPVTFQFVPKEFSEKIINAEKIAF